MDIKITKTTHPKEKPNWDELSFGTVFTDHMLMIDYLEGEGWKDARIIPYQDICCLLYTSISSSTSTPSPK